MHQLVGLMWKEQCLNTGCTDAEKEDVECFVNCGYK